MDGTCTVVNVGDTMTPTTAGVCYTLTFDDSVDTTTFTIDTTGLTGLVIAGQHVPLEFESDTHYLYDSAGVYNEPIAQEGGLRYAFFTCSSDGATVSYGEECGDDACAECLISGANVASGTCYIAGGYVHVVECDSTGTTATINIYEKTSLTCSSDLTGETISQVHTHTSGTCEVEEHDHEGDNDEEMSGAHRTPVFASLLIAAGALFFAL